MGNSLIKKILVQTAIGSKFYLGKKTNGYDNVMSDDVIQCNIEFNEIVDDERSRHDGVINGFLGNIMLM